MDLEQAGVVVLQAIQHAIDTDSSSSSDEEEENNLMRRLIGVAREPNDIPIRVENYIDNVVFRSSPEIFQSHFRLTWEAYETIENEIGPTLNRNVNEFGFGRPCMPIRKQILSVLWLLATPESYRSIGDRFDMGKSSLFHSFQLVVQALNEIAPRVITWPSPERRQVIRQHLEEAGGLPNVVGAIDGTFIRIKAPRDDKEVYVTRKCCYAYTLQGICDHELKFIDVFSGYPGSVSDIRIFENSHIYHDIIGNQGQYFSQGEFIIGDKAYPVFDWCVAPFIDRGNLTQAQRNFNTALSRQRASIERCWSLLFGRFRRLKYLDMNRNDLIPGTIVACCVLHNICLDHGPGEMEEYEVEGRRYVLQNNDPPVERENRGIEEYDLEFHNIAGTAYRNQLCTRFNNRILPQ
ncbi:hypothetical protein HCN44_010802 [Aphidius gifuensis]|uniref:DDE Tnp4 domain-containing protein n=1 Tax=Aphidius gifuensis TaxID=684658 RepID=A0A834Y437_APHGI|nr:hypothetical protein HCN44_010802 [Aphidius gifuensis]